MLSLQHGSVVEVRSTEEGFSGARFEAVLIKPPVTSKAGYCKALVEYKTLLTSPNKKRLYKNAPISGGNSKAVREFVDFSDLRPQPPKEAQEFFELNEVVDAFKDEGWWTGVVNAILADSSYCVLFENPPDQLRFTADKLRPHLNWIGGRWIRPGKKGIQELVSSVGSKIEVIPFGESSNNRWVPSVVLTNDGNNQIVVKYQSSVNCYVADCVKGVTDIHNIRPRPPALHKHKYFYLENVDAVTDSCWRSGQINHDLRRQRYVVLFRPDLLSMDYSSSELRPHLDWRDGKWFCGKSLLITSEYRAQAKTGRKNTNHEELILQIGFSGTEDGEIPGSVLSTNNQIDHSSVYGVRSPSCDEASGKKKMDHDTNLLRPASAKKLKVWRMSPSLRSNSSSNVSESPTLESPTLENIIESIDDGAKNAKNDLCGLGAALKNQTVKCPRDPSIGFVANEQEAVPDVDQPLSIWFEDVHPSKRDESNGTVKNAIAKANETQKIEDDVVRRESSPGTPSPPSRDISTVNNMKTTETCYNIAMQASSSSPAHDSTIPDKSVGESNKEERYVDVNDVVMQGTSMDVSQVNKTEVVGESVQESPLQGLCFAKVSPIWKTLEALEAFRSVPQNPHFSPLIQDHEEVREGLAIAYMVTFVNLMEKSSKLRVDDPRSFFDGMLKAADVLISNGFDVGVLQRRLHDLLLLKSEWMRLVDPKMTNEAKMDIICGEICEIKKQLKELEEKHKQALTRKLELEMQMDEIRRVESDFAARATVL